jgi:hypothetical protein
MLYAPRIAASETVEFGLTWDANTERDLDGYEIYFKKGGSGAAYQFLAEVYVDELEDPDNPRAIITNLYNGVGHDPETTIRMGELADTGTYYFGLTAFDTYGNISEFSEEICVKVKGQSVSKCRSIDSQNNDDDAGGSRLENLVDLGNLGCFISTANYLIREKTNVWNPGLVLYCLLMAGVLGWKARKNIR